MMAISSAAQGLGGALGAALGGAVLLRHGYEAQGVTLGAMALTSVLVYQLFVIENVRVDC
jgi:predicted MFS family arabinose efflux permease